MSESTPSFVSLLWGTLFLRPYVFIFLAAYLCLATRHLGLGPTLLYLLLGYGIAWTSEFCSIHTGIPYGLYMYIPATHSQELWVLGVPLMDSLSYVFLSYASYSLALFLLAPLPRSPVSGHPVNTGRYNLATLLLAVVLFVTLDIIIDPLALRGYRWFLGQIYGYPEAGIYFGIPLSNFVGWFVVGLVMVAVLQRLSHWSVPFPWLSWGQSRSTNDGYLGAGLYLGILLFNLILTFYIGETLLGLVGLFIYLPFTTLAILVRCHPGFKAN
ncbi:carotenoid biosynthesis protein [Desulfobacca acetoxidans]|uniref:Carotenoid biosynthesis protein n=1 Tax=Desulfobacca acetoxidans (strain ATCC 700848 / DSM 11109 / ASRB2) TaxID=880072 RepID=F2NCD9_DESAR|nr:carotenoid biosynthesis protein [Desulfobacca acetoxidans]AEB09003.1 protein of unknown function DUF422 [Desulfobacca acetoxidans DSM 11109]